MAQIYLKKASDGLPKAAECSDDGALKYITEIKTAVEALSACVSAGKVQVDTEINATLDPTGLATQTTSAAILAKLIAAPATEGKQDAISAKLPASLGKKAASASLSVVQADPVRTIVSHVKDLTGSAVALSAISLVVQDLWLLQVGSTETAYWGDSSVQAGHGIPLSATVLQHIPGPIDIANVYVNGNAADDVAFNYTYEA